MYQVGCLAALEDRIESFSAAGFDVYVGTSSGAAVATALAGMTDGTGLMSKINTAIDPYTASDGTIKAKIDALATRSRNIDTQVGSMQTRLDKYEEGLRAQYTALESTISKLQSQGSSLTSAISSL